MYCERCMRLFEGGACPECRRPGRPVREDDYALAAELGNILSDMYADVLRQEHIPALTRGDLGAGLSTIVGPQADVTRFYVPVPRLEDARVLAREFFGNDTAGEPPEEEKGADDDPS